MKSLIIVESPTKARTIKQFLGKDYEVIASKGHIRDLPKRTMGIKFEDGSFIPEYIIDDDHKKVVDEIIKLTKKADKVYIATDEDREGEAIGYHIAVAIGKKPESLPRIVFHEITKNAILDSLKNPRNIDMDRVNAQQARRLLDRIVGYRLSPLISSKIQRGLSAGRVQSSALKIIVDREKEILNFKPITYYVIDVVMDNIPFELVEFNGEKIDKLSIQDKKEADNIVKILKDSRFSIFDIENKKKKTSTPPPFMTSTLQQSASSILGFSPSKTMQTAQKLYEGVMTHNGVMGVITYMRTDSLNIAKIAQDEARELILKQYGREYVPQKPKIYTTKSKGAQEAHEAIRPTSLEFTPEIAAQYLKSDELRLYSLIYKRFLASQMNDAEFDLQNIIVSNGVDSKLKASGRRLIFDGFYKVLGADDKDNILPKFDVGDSIKLIKCDTVEKQTEPPSRFSEASMIKILESLGIGRPSTYAPTISLLSNRDYISIEKKQIRPQEVAFKVVELLEKYFFEIVDSKFTANLEEKLDDIAEGNQEWQELLVKFYEPFMDKIKDGKENIKSQKIAIPTGEICPLCGKELIKRSGRYGEFVGCSGYPKCKFIKKEIKEVEAESFGECDKCGLPMIKKVSKNGEFLACSGYPKCKNAQPISKPESIDVKCPKCSGDIIERRSKRGVFYGCTNYPKCDFISNFKPVDKKCPKCESVMAERIYRGKDIFECIACKERITKEDK